MSGVLRMAWAWLVFSMSYTAIVVLGLPRPLYLPIEKRVVFEAAPGAITMSWYGVVLVAAAVAGLAWTLPIERLLARSGGRSERSWLLAMLLGVALSALLLAGFELRPS